MNSFASWELIMKLLILMVQGTQWSLDGIKERDSFYDI